MQPEQSPYDFILSNSQQQNKSSMAGGGPSSMLGRALIFGGILFVLLIIGIVLMSVLGSDGGSRASLLVVTQTQQETVRVADEIRKDSSSQPINNVSVNISYSVMSDKQTLSNAAGPAGIAFDEKELALGQNPKTNTLLENSKTTGTYNEVSLQILNTQIAQYQKALADSYEKTKNPEIKAALLSSSKNATLLQTQLTNTRP